MNLTPKRPKSQNGFFGSSGRLSKLQKHDWVSEILEEGRTMKYLWGKKEEIEFGVVGKSFVAPMVFFGTLGKAGYVIYTNPKIWRPCEKMGHGWPWKGRGRVES
jgi:hypothetical protein